MQGPQKVPQMLTIVKSALLNMSCDTMFPFISEAVKLPKEAAETTLVLQSKNMEKIKTIKFFFKLITLSYVLF